jgi:hypothetical protein
VVHQVVTILRILLAEKSIYLHENRREA